MGSTDVSPTVPFEDSHLLGNLWPLPRGYGDKGTRRGSLPFKLWMGAHSDFFSLGTREPSLASLHSTLGRWSRKVCDLTIVTRTVAGPGVPRDSSRSRLLALDARVLFLGGGEQKVGCPCGGLVTKMLCLNVRLLESPMGVLAEQSGL